MAAPETRFFHEAGAMQRLRRHLSLAALTAVLVLALAACEPADPPGPATAPGPQFVLTGHIEDQKIDEASGLAAGEDGVFFVHNDGGDRLYAMDGGGRSLGRMKVRDARNKDWEDLARIPSDEGPILVIGDIGDNTASRKDIRLYFVREPGRDALNSPLRPFHRLDVRYSDGAKDAESMAYDAHSDMILLLSKRDKPPLLYGIPRDLALVKRELRAEFIGAIRPLPPPTRGDILRSPKRGMWVSQPTGMDISADGRLAAVITYRSLYLYERRGNEAWIDALRRAPAEIPGPPGLHDEAVAITPDQQSVYVTTERLPTPVHRLGLDEAVFRQIRREIPAEP